MGYWNPKTKRWESDSTAALGLALRVVLGVLILGAIALFSWLK